ncbi:MAG: haloacid dehalogenase-like hydrolase [Pseudomonadota bacterium]|nr:haloacid dehalogenase-like hydrolase [Pseudomonadota bacterium]
MREKAQIRLFDFDGTLTAPALDRYLMGQHVPRIYGFIARELGLTLALAREKSDGYYHQYGSTIHGLVAHREVDPVAYLAETFRDVDLSDVSRDQRLVDAFSVLRAAFPGCRNYVFTNGSAVFVQTVMDRLGISGFFEDCLDPPAVAYRPKTDPDTFRHVCNRFGVSDRAMAWMYEDSLVNARAAHTAGLNSVYVSRKPLSVEETGVGHVISDLPDFLMKQASEAEARQPGK